MADCGGTAAARGESACIASAGVDFGATSGCEDFRSDGLNRATPACEPALDWAGAAAASADGLVFGGLTGSAATGGASSVGVSGAEEGTELLCAGAGADAAVAASGAGGREALRSWVQATRSSSIGAEAMHSRRTRKLPDGCGRLQTIVLPVPEQEPNGMRRFETPYSQDAKLGKMNVADRDPLRSEWLLGTGPS